MRFVDSVTRIRPVGLLCVDEGVVYLYVQLYIMSLEPEDFTADLPLPSATDSKVLM